MKGTSSHTTASTRSRKILLALTVIGALVAVMFPIAPAGASDGDHAGTGKITFCHATSSATNPYVLITTDPASIIKRGHGDHAGDKIPPFHYSSQATGTGDFPGINWDPTKTAAQQCGGGGGGGDEVDPDPVNAIFSGTKFNDIDGTGTDTIDDIPLSGWTITVELWTPDTSDTSDGAAAGAGAFSQVGTATTGADGLWSYSTDSALPAPAGTTSRHRFCEVQKTGWAQTGPVSASEVVTSNATAALGVDDADQCYVVDAKTDVNAVVGSLDFFNETRGSISGSKFDGMPTAGGTKLSDWPIRLFLVEESGSTEVDRTLTDANGNYEFDDLPAGSYRVEEQQAISTTTLKWTQVFPAAPGTHTATMSATSPSNASETDFGNSCEVRSAIGGRTKGFWTNKNGENTFHNVLPSTGNNAEENLAGLRGLNLVRPANKQGVNPAFDPTSYSQVKTFLSDANATDMRFMLSAQMAATWLNTRNGDRSPTMITDRDAVITAAVGTIQTMTIEQWIGRGNTLVTGSNRIEQGQIKDLFDAINQGKKFSDWAAATGCTQSFPTLAALP